MLFSMLEGNEEGTALAATLAQRYAYGNFAELPSLSREADFFLGIPARQKEMLSVARTHVREQELAAQAIVESNLVGAGAICAELTLQAGRLRAAIESGSRTTTAAIETLTCRVSGELSQIRWELEELQSIAEQILDVLRSPRTTEAHELLAQSIQHLVNNQLDQAEERFQLARRLDSTDHRILMGLSSVSLRQGEAPQAIAFAQDALTLPAHLDETAKADALWHLGRIHYSTQQYDRALLYGGQSVALLPLPGRVLHLGAYAILSGDTTHGLQLVERAVREEPGLFAVAASAPDFRDHMDYVLYLLSDLAAEALTAAEGNSRDLADQIANVRNPHGAAKEGLERLSKRHERVRQSLSNPSYSAAREAGMALAALKPIPEVLAALSGSAERLEAATEGERLAAERLAAAQSEVNRIQQYGCVAPLLAATLAACILMVPAVLSMPPESQHLPGAWPMIIGFGFLGVLIISLFLFSAFSDPREKLVATSQADLNARNADVEQARGRLQAADRMAANALNAAGC